MAGQQSEKRKRERREAQLEREQANRVTRWAGELTPWELAKQQRAERRRAKGQAA